MTKTTTRTFAGGRGRLVKDVGEPEWVAYYGDTMLGYLIKRYGGWDCYRNSAVGFATFSNRGRTLEATANAAWPIMSRPDGWTLS